jgi:hypothetical protein
VKGARRKPLCRIRRCPGFPRWRGGDRPLFENHGRENRIERKPRANNTYFRAMKRSPNDAVDTGNPLFNWRGFRGAGHPNRIPAHPGAERNVFTMKSATATASLRSSTGTSRSSVSSLTTARSFGSFCAPRQRRSELRSLRWTSIFGRSLFRNPSVRTMSMSGR